MIIQCLIERDGPTHVNINCFPYTFAKNEHGHYVAPVNSTEHQAWLLRTPKSFRVYLPTSVDAAIVPVIIPAIQPESKPVTKPVTPAKSPAPKMTFQSAQAPKSRKR